MKKLFTVTALATALILPSLPAHAFSLGSLLSLVRFAVHVPMVAPRYRTVAPRYRTVAPRRHAAPVVRTARASAPTRTARAPAAAPSSSAPSHDVLREAASR
jgi:hypothetical protein